MSPDEELLALAARLKAAGRPAVLDTEEQKLNSLIEKAEEAGRSFSGSWLGYHARVYYEGLRPAPPGAHFSQEWGLESTFSGGTTGSWGEFDPESVRAEIQHRAGDPDLGTLKAASHKAAIVFDEVRSEIESILAGVVAETGDRFLERLAENLKGLMLLSASDVAQVLMPKGKFISRDAVAVGQGIQVPPHISLIAEMRSLSQSFGVCISAAELATKAASHLARQLRRRRVDARVGTNVFIGHGRSSAWRELKDFIQDRLRLPPDEFNRVPVAGVTNIARLAEMLDSAAVALLVMTAEDEMAEGKLRARENVVHEVGLFQGRLGFTKAIVLLEDGCEEFSNIQGLGQIRFPKGRISAAFEEVRHVLEREGLLGDAS